MAEPTRWAIAPTHADAPLIVLPEGCAESGAWRHAREHAAETDTEVQVFRAAGDGWEPLDVAHPPCPGYLDVRHYHHCNTARCVDFAVAVVPLADVLAALRELDPVEAALAGQGAFRVAADLLAERFGDRREIDNA